MTSHLVGLLVAAFVFVPPSERGMVSPPDSAATVWYLGHAGWGVRFGETLLIFDYQEVMHMEEVGDDPPRGLANGFVDPEEISDLDVYVFVSHAHGDHFDPVIFDWQGQIDRLTYVIGWDDEPESVCERLADPGVACLTMEGLRATAQVGDLEIYTIDSDHNDIPEVAYLVRSGDWTVYHNGDYLADHVGDYAYLKTIANHIDLAFVAGIPGNSWPHLARAVHLARQFEVPVLFPMHFRDREMCDGFATDVASAGVTADVRCPTARGQQFLVARGLED